MTCKEVTDILQLYVDGLTDQAEARLAEEHLAGCPACREQVAGWRDAAMALQSLQPVTAPPGFFQQVMERVAFEPMPAIPGSTHDGTSSSLRVAARPAWPFRLSWSWAAAASLMVGIGLVLWLGPEESAAANAARGLLQLLSRLVSG